MSRRNFLKTYKKQGKKILNRLFILDNMPTFMELEKALCDEPITLEECKKAIFKMKTDKSPGTDGCMQSSTNTCGQR